MNALIYICVTIGIIATGTKLVRGIIKSNNVYKALNYSTSELIWASLIMVWGITVNAIAPGFIVTAMSRAGRTDEEMRVLTARLCETTMVRRTGCPEDIGNAVAFLASPHSGFVTAQLLTVDGGRMDYIGHV